MSTYDPKKAAQVWQRVQAQNQTAPDQTTLLTLMEQEQEDAATYFYLSRQFVGKEAAALRQIARREKQC